MKNRLSSLLCALLLVTVAVRAQGQEQSEDVLRVRTRAVFIDTLVRDKKTREAIKDLKAENFQVFDNGKPRTLTYFSNEGMARKRPLALVLVLNLPRYVEDPSVMEQIISALGALKPDDEVSIFQTWAEKDGSRPLDFVLRSKWVLSLTRDRQKIYAALRETQKFARQNMSEVKDLLSLKDAMGTALKDALKHPDPLAIDPPFNVRVASDYEYIIEKLPSIATQERPNSQVVVIETTDDFGASPFGKSREDSKRLLATGVTYNGLILKPNLFGKFVNFAGNIMAPLMGMRFELAEYYSTQTGGDAVTVSTPQSFASAVSQIISNLTARYSLGFTLAEGEKDDGRLHQLQVKVRQRDSRGKERKFIISARQGYYMPAVISTIEPTNSAPNRFTNSSGVTKKR